MDKQIFNTNIERITVEKPILIKVAHLGFPDSINF